MFNLKRPCDSCPFRKVGGIRLDERRAREVAGYFVNVENARPWTGATFPCHNTVVDVDEDDETPDARSLRGDWELCAGGVILGRKLGGTQAQIVQLAERLGCLKPDDLKDADQVVDSLDELFGLSFRRDGRTR